jgi:hypothetical protein
MCKCILKEHPYLYTFILLCAYCKEGRKIFSTEIIFFDQIYFVFHGLKTFFFCYSLKFNFICYLNIFFTFDYSLWDGGRHTFFACKNKTNFNFSLYPSPPSPVRTSKIFFVAFFSVTVDGRNLIFGHKPHIGIPYRG